MKRSILISLFAILVTALLSGPLLADGNFTGYPDSQKIWLSATELRLRDEAQIGLGDGTRTAPDATFSYDSVNGRLTLIGATFMAQSGQESSSGNTGTTENVALVAGSIGTFIIEDGLIINFTTPSPTPTPSVTPTPEPTPSVTPTPEPTPSPE